jgi:hypothetical protein
MNEIVRQRVTPLIEKPSTLTIDSTGRSPYPSDFQQGDAMWTTSMQRIRFVPQHKLYSYLNSQIDPINSNPIFLIEDDNFLFYPNTTYNNVTVGSALLSYVKTPPTIVWGFTNDTNGIPVYAPGSSVDPIWFDVDMLEIISRALKMSGVNLEAAMVEQYGENIIKAGQ